MKHHVWIHAPPRLKCLTHMHLRNKGDQPQLTSPRIIIILEWIMFMLLSTSYCYYFTPHHLYYITNVRHHIGLSPVNQQCRRTTSQPTWSQYSYGRVRQYTQIANRPGHYAHVSVMYIGILYTDI